MFSLSLNKKCFIKLLLLPEWFVYTRIKTPFLVNRLRKKEQIVVAFVIFELGSWKTENLYLSMLSHNRFCPLLIVVPSLDNANENNILKAYLLKKKYTFFELNDGETIKKRFHPDIIFYQKPYSRCFKKSVFYRNNLSSLFCYMSYCFRNTTLNFNQNSFFHNYAWQIYVENNIMKKELELFMDNKGKNLVVTGLTVMDDLMKNKENYVDPWKPLGNRKRIIYAPHHTINNEIVNRSTFLQYYDFMLELAEKYKDEVQWAFKPHPLLKAKLYKLWGEKKTNDYFARWSYLENTQYEYGEYMGLFKYSDAMIHDCGSFIIEYLYTLKPVMYLANNDVLDEHTNNQTRKSLELHYIGRNRKDIETFIQNVIAGKDVMREERLKFYNSNLIPNTKSSSENVIDAILGYNIT